MDFLFLCKTCFTFGQNLIHLTSCQMKLFLCILVFVLIVELLYSPRIDIADEKVILWYGRDERKWIVLFELE